MKGPGLFSDLGKRAKDLLTKDYTYDQTTTRSTVTAFGVGLTSTAVKKGGLYYLDISSAYKNKNTLIDFKVDTESNISTTIAVMEALPSTKLEISVNLANYNTSTTSTVSKALPSTKLMISVKLPDYNAGKLKLQHFHENATFATVVCMKSSPMIEFSGTVGAQGVAFGAKGRYYTARGKFRKCSDGIGVTKKYYHAALILVDKGDTINVYGLYHFDRKRKVSAVAQLTHKLSTNENNLTVGILYTVDV